MSRFDGKALELSRQAMKLFFEPIPGVQLQAKLQNLFISAMEYSEPVTAATGWIKCSERMPDRDVDVQVYCSDKKEQMVGYLERNEGEGWFRFATWRNGDGIYCQPTHWKPLTSAPEQEV